MWDGTELEVLKALRGRLYVRSRDQVLATQQGFEDVLAQTQAGPDRRLELTATFLAAWARDRERQESFERMLDAVDVKAESKNVTGLGGAIRLLVDEAREAHGEALLPFCWERIVKLSEITPAWKVGACFEMIRQTATESSIEPLLWCVDEATTPGLIDAAHQALQALPFLGLKDRLAAGMSLHTMRRYVYEDMLLRIKVASKKKGP